MSLDGSWIQTKRERLAYLRGQEAFAADPAQKFQLKKQIQELEAELADAHASSRAATQKIWTVPHARNPYFTAREDALEALHRTLHEDGRAVLGQTQAISGLGGIGKTQTAVEYAYRHRDDYDAILWIGGQTEGDLVSGFEEIAREFRLAGEDPEQRIAAVHRWMRNHESWLLVVDNADEPELLKPYLPTGAKGHVLLTSRARYFGALAIPKPLQLDTLAPADAVAFLLERVGRETPGATETEAASTLAEMLGYLPLALEQAGAFLAGKQTRFEVYLAAYRRGEALSSKPETGDYPNSVAETWLLNFEAVEAISEASADVLRMSAFMAPDLIPEELLLEGASELGKAIAEALGKEADSLMMLDVLLEPLSRYSLIRRIPRERAFSVHRLVQEVVQQSLKDSEKRSIAESLVAALAQAYPGEGVTSWPLCDRLVPHWRVVANTIYRLNLESKAAGAVLGQAGFYAHERVRYGEAASLYERALKIREKVLGEKHPDIATSLNNLAMLHQDQGEYALAAPLHQRALKIREKVLGEEHPDVATSLNNLAMLHQAQGEYPQAAPLYQRALKIREKVLGREHPDVATSFNNLAILHQDQGEYPQAAPLYQRALDIREKVLGEEHPDVANSLNNLAMLHQAQGEYPQAAPLYQRALKIREKVLGREHPHVAISFNNLAMLHQDQGEYPKAAPLYQRAREILEKVLGEEHPDVAISLNNLAMLHQDQGEYLKAAPLLEQALKILEKVLGEEHPDVANSLNNLAMLHKAQGEYPKATPLLERALKIREKVLGEEHPHVANSLNNLAMLHKAKGEYSQAAPLYRRALKVRKKVLGEEHPHVATSLNNLAMLHKAQGEYHQAALLYQRALEIREKVLGEEHPQVANSLNNLAMLHQDQSEYHQAAPLCQRALGIYEKVLGEDHPHTQRIRERYASLQKLIAQSAKK